MILNVSKEDRGKSGIYEIRNNLNGHVYVGSAVHLRKRYNKHVQHIRVRRNACPQLQQAAIKHGIENFTFSVLEFCNKDVLHIREQYWIDKFNSAKKGYNSCPLAGTTAGRIMSEETKEKLRKANLGKKLSEEVKERLRIASSKIVLTPEQRAKISAKKKGVKKTAAMVELMRGENNIFSKPIIQLSISGEIIKTWASCGELVRQTGYSGAAIKRCAKHKQISAYGYLWHYPGVEYKNKSERLKERAAKITGEKSSSAKKICQYSLDGVFIKEYSCSRDANNTNPLYKRQNIQHAATGKYKTAYGFIWKYKHI